MQPTTTQIAEARKKAKLTQAQAAALVHSKTRAWQRWEAGERAMCPAYWELFTIKIALN
ncbi:helix-turn-helix domain-containing protein [Polynucleobacter sp.]|jgi:DNA-binding transcriptional regulator YiaG|uniref:helix-turn-helix domain-containing protein n=1 Tax=Polynucleobacter sp. TaxID=2029855 RepID=UPI003F696027